MMFEFDLQKSEANKCKHGIDFVEAQNVWLDDRMLVISANNITELRELAVGQINGKLWSVVYTVRPPNIRIISARRARKNEVLLYDKT